MVKHWMFVILAASASAAAHANLVEYEWDQDWIDTSESPFTYYEGATGFVLDTEAREIRDWWVEVEGDRYTTTSSIIMENNPNSIATEPDNPDIWELYLEAEFGALGTVYVSENWSMYLDDDFFVSYADPDNWILMRTSIQGGLLMSNTQARITQAAQLFPQFQSPPHSAFSAPAWR